MRLVRFLALAILARACAGDPQDISQLSSPVRAQLHIPPAETQVIGDNILLFWRFENVSAEPLAFMWEGCCRLNGRLTVTHNGAPIAPIPPGQALAHMFAKAERLQPGAAIDLDTRLSDWVKLDRSGVYEFRGRYTGVLPDQRPQVPKGMKLWREAATTPPISLAVITVQDYLQQRLEREARRGLRLELSGTNRLAPLTPSPLQLCILNTSPANQTLRWPNAVQLWLVHQTGERVASASSVDASYEELAIAPGARVKREIPFDWTRLEGEPWGDYSVFVDLQAEGELQPRVPSNVTPLRWRLDAPDLQRLIPAAAEGPKTGLRNAPLKLLRVYLAELQPDLAAIEKGLLSPGAAVLAEQLLLASTLKPIAPRPGRVEPHLHPDERAEWVFSDAVLRAQLDKVRGGLADKVSVLLGVRRHLGWEVSLALDPNPDTSMTQLAEAARQLAGLGGDLAAPLRVAGTRAADANAPLAGRIVLPDRAPPANLVVRFELNAEGTGLRGSAARRLPDPAQPQMTAAFSPGELATVPVTPLESAASLETLVINGPQPAPRAAFLTPGTAPWRLISEYAEPLLKHGTVVNLLLKD